MNPNSRLRVQDIRHPLETGMSLTKCRQCGCMVGTLHSLSGALATLDSGATQALADDVAVWRTQTEPVRYACLGCAECYPALAESALVAIFPDAALAEDLRCGFQVDDTLWPPVVGEYVVLDPQAPVAVTTLSSAALVESLAHAAPPGLAIVGKTETENIGLDKVVKNVVTNSALQYLIVAGIESDGHRAGDALLALAAHGVDDTGRIIASAARRPVLRNISRDDIRRFREQVRVVDLRGCDDVAVIAAQVTALAVSGPASPVKAGEETASPDTNLINLATSVPQTPAASDTCADPGCGCHAGHPARTVAVPLDLDPSVVLDRAGYFVILPLQDRRTIHVEHYSYDHLLQHAIDGQDVRALYLTIVRNGWVTELSHAAYIGRELTKAALSLEYGFKYVQDAA